jgi:hypothetical protein
MTTKMMTSKADLQPYNKVVTWYSAHSQSSNLVNGEEWGRHADKSILDQASLEPEPLIQKTNSLSLNQNISL